MRVRRGAAFMVGRGAAFIVARGAAFWLYLIEATVVPFTSVSVVLATLAFLAVLSVLIKDFF